MTQFKLFAGRPRDVIQRVNEWLAAHDRYICDWKVALDTGDPSVLGSLFLIVEYHTLEPDREDE